MATYASLDMLSLPAWKWVALVEAWAWDHVDEDNTGLLEADLSRPVDFTWAQQQSENVVNAMRPDTWQTNTKGETLIGGKKRTERGE